MPLRKSAFFVLILFAFAVLTLPFYFHTTSTQAAVESCTATINPTTFDVQSSTEFRVTVGNTGSTDATFVKITPPSNQYTITTQYSNDPWAGGTEEDGTMLFRNGAITPNNSMMFTMVVVTGSATSASDVWKIETSDDDGTTLTQCNGNLNTGKENQFNISAPVISNITISDIKTTSAKITWTTDKNTTTKAVYGTTSSYGQEKTDPTLTTSHTVTLSDLTANTSYHFRVSGTDSDGNNSESYDGNFTTASSATTQSITIILTPTPSPTIKPTPTPIPDTTPPKISLDTDFSKPFAQTPKISGKATDNKNIAKIEYSADGGTSWSAADNANGIGTSKSTFEFTPLTPDEGSYIIMARAYDDSNNKAQTNPVTLVIDRLPPQVGSYVLSTETQIIEPNENGVRTITAGTPVKATFSSIGGATKITLKTNKQEFPLQFNKDTRLWSVDLNFTEPGQYPLSLNAIDGANNQTQRTLLPLRVASLGNVVSETNVTIPNTKVTTYKKDPQTQQFVIWDAASYGQSNPYKIPTSGQYSVLLPSGTYYIQATAPGYQPTNTPIFTTLVNKIVNVDFFLKKDTRLFGFLLPTIANTNNQPITKEEFQTISDNSLNGTDFPSFKLTQDDASITKQTLLGKQSIITVLNTWSPQSQDQLSVLSGIKDEERNIVTVFPQESEAAIRVFQTRGGYQIPMIADPLGSFIEKLNIQSTPTTFFISPDGRIESIKTGLVTKEDIVNNDN